MICVSSSTLLSKSTLLCVDHFMEKVTPYEQLVSLQTTFMAGIDGKHLKLNHGLIFSHQSASLGLTP